MILHKGSPADLTGRLEVEKNTYALLDSLGIAFDRIDHEPAMTMEACAAVDAALGGAICKNLLLCNRQCTAFYLLMLPGDKVFKTKELSAQIGSSRLSFASGEYMQQFLNITPGSLSVLGLMNDTENRVQLLIDEELLNAEEFGCHPCINTSSLRIKTRDLLDKILPAVHHDYRSVTLPRSDT
jgi:Ala-tRNA(Pro) deacylase